jgi:hypothetical protein
MRERFGGIRKGEYAALKAGEPVAERYILALVCLIRQTGPDSSEFVRLASLVEEFLAAEGECSQEQLTDEDLINCLCTPPLDRQTACSTRVSDWLISGFVSLPDVFSFKRDLRQCLWLCESMEDVCDAIRWLFITAGRTQTKNEVLPSAAAVGVCESILRCSMQQYQHRVLQWWRHDPWTVVMSRGRNRPGGASIILPMQPAVYEEIRRGRRFILDCGPDCGQFPSDRLMFEAIGGRPFDEGGESADATRSLLIMSLFQIAHLSRSCEDTLRILAFVFDDLQRKRAVSFGYRPTDTHMHTTDWELFERVLPVGWGVRPADLLLLSVIRFFRELLQRDRDRNTKDNS